MLAGKVPAPIERQLKNGQRGVRLSTRQAPTAGMVALLSPPQRRKNDLPLLDGVGRCRLSIVDSGLRTQGAGLQAPGAGGGGRGAGRQGSTKYRLSGNIGCQKIYYRKVSATLLLSQNLFTDRVPECYHVPFLNNIWCNNCSKRLFYCLKKYPKFPKFG